MAGHARICTGAAADTAGQPVPAAREHRFPLLGTRRNAVRRTGHRNGWLPAQAVKPPRAVRWPFLLSPHPAPGVGAGSLLGLSRATPFTPERRLSLTAVSKIADGIYPVN